MMTEDKINPQHYDGDLCNCAIAMITDTMRGVVAVDIGFAIKHLWRRGRKPGEDKADDLGKARWYLDWIESTMGHALRSSDLGVIAKLRELAARDADVRVDIVELATGSRELWCNGRMCQDTTCEYCRGHTVREMRDRWNEFLRAQRARADAEIAADPNAPTKRLLPEEGGQ